MRTVYPEARGSFNGFHIKAFDGGYKSTVFLARGLESWTSKIVSNCSANAKPGTINPS